MMPNLRNLRATDVQPQDTGAVSYQPYASSIGSGLSSLASAVENQRSVAAADARMRGAEEAEQQKRLDAAAKGSALGEFVGETASFLEDSVENEIARAEADVVESGGVVGTTGSEVLEGASRLSRVEKHLRSTGQMNTLHQIKLLRKQSELISRRPDLGEDIVRLTNAAATDANAILAADENRAVELAARKRAEEEKFYDDVLKANNDLNFDKSFAEKKRQAGIYQFYQQSKQAAADELLDLEQQDKKEALLEGKDERAFQAANRNRKVRGQAVIDSNYLPSLSMGMAADARALSQRGLSKEEADREWANKRQLALADMQETIKDPELYNQAATRINSQFDMYAGYVNGSTLTEGLKEQVARTESEAMMRFYNVGGPQAASFVAVAGKVGPVLGDVIGRSRMDMAATNTLNSLLVGLDQAGVKVSTSEINLPSGRGRTNPRANTPNLGANSPYLLPGQQPKDVSDTQVRNTTATLLGVVEASGRAESRMLPSERAVASQAVVAGFTDPVVARDPANIKAMMYGLAGLSNNGAAFVDNPDADRARKAAYATMGNYLDSTVAFVEEQMGRPAGELFTYRKLANGGLVVEAKPGAGLFPTLAQRLEQDANAAVKAWAHLHGKPLSLETTESFLK